MKYKLILPTLALCTTSLFVAPAVAEHHEKGVHGSASIQNMGEFRVSHLMGAKLEDSAGNDIGKIQDFVVDPNSGRIQFAVVNLDNDLARDGKQFTPVPWPLISRATASDLNRQGQPKSFVLNVDRNKIASAQRFHVDTWPQQYSSHMRAEKARPVHWGQDVYTYYGVPWEGAAMGATGSAAVTETVRPYNYQYEDTRNPRDLRSNYDKPIDNGTAPDGKDVFKFSPRPWPNSEYVTE